MNTETELKLTIQPGDLRKILRLGWLQSLASGPARRKKLVSIYFDTGKFALRDHRVTLRVRKIGSRRVQTIKAFPDSTGGVFCRNEWEAEISSDRPDFQFAKGTALAPLITRKLKRALKPVFETNIARTALPIHSGTSDIEVALDRGYIRTGRRHLPVNEIELELKKGKPEDLVRLAGKFARLLPVGYGARTKAERGYRLSAGERCEPVEAEDIVLSSRASVAEAFAVIGFSCLHHLAGNEEAVLRGVPEGVHQMRVGLRRLRAAISLFKEIVWGPETDRIKTELKWLTEQLAPARDFDVLVREGVIPLREAVPDQPEIALLKSDLEVRRDDGFARAKATVASARYREALLQTALWLSGGKWLRNSNALVAAKRDRPIRGFAANVLRRRTRKIVKKVARLESLDARRRHKLRIASKKLRYATEFFASLFDGRKARASRRSFLKSLKALQDALGKLNDIVVHRKLAREYAHPKTHGKRRSAKAYAMGVLTGQEQKLAKTCMAAAVKSGKRLSDAPHFWL